MAKTENKGEDNDRIPAIAESLYQVHVVQKEVKYKTERYSNEQLIIRQDEPDQK
jgi:hypothetical protein